ncbi:tRNA epoxyqueuosine(34) reductase QueG [Pantoea agglomerans]|uniref:tRNA epoxyqueuosine(34) reductase QueG n=1 Tax=Enterobacter agglomerans TaxID=549 RepID=UPI00057EA178|nr:tRNA epoxyqueuosine(34) reductase QueG [Pantoea agglomerans]AOE39189.1 tRNA epoxyqueuosine(34) reductase QueG [Pantoea agglomerans]KIC86191.1 [Fe-S]-binding protein [Pantoea agglomerans]MBA5704664.1 tRNA epoxyqueuosine(34) reductase QueG [Pantoea agglomerans]NKE92887.1 tRNA epoxyqueuosine(34) reductase QueG [Pantoea agglomerans]TRO74044.1 tRNA epoxyqueuosine(34) reductase QueG [Pantoea agglomerans]
MSYPLDLHQFAQQIKQWGLDLGFQQVGITDTDLSAEEPRLQAWLDKQYHGEMEWMARHGMMRARPHELLPGTLRVISVRMNYLPAKAAFASTLKNPQLGYVSRYALGRDYHKVLRNRLKKLGEMIQQQCGELNFRPFVDSAPLLERPLAAKAGLGWTGKHSLILNREAGSWFFLGELLIDIPLPVDTPQQEQCGRCVACMTICPTSAIVEPYVVDARRCISYLTIELEGAIPEEFRPLMGNRIYGCDDCQLICPWNRYGQLSDESDFSPRAALHAPELIDLFQWNEAKFLRITEGSAIRRIGHLRWLRNIAVALGNAPWSPEIVQVLEQRLGESDLLDEHILWAITQQQQKREQLVVEVQPAQQKRLVRAVEKGLPRDA